MARGRGGDSTGTSCDGGANGLEIAGFLDNLTVANSMLVTHRDREARAVFVAADVVHDGRRHLAEVPGGRDRGFARCGLWSRILFLIARLLPLSFRLRRRLSESAAASAFRAASDRKSVRVFDLVKPVSEG